MCRNSKLFQCRGFRIDIWCNERIALINYINYINYIYFLEELQLMIAKNSDFSREPLMLREAKKAQQNSYEISDQKKEETKTFIEKEGMKIITPSDEEFEKMKKLSQPVWDSVREQCGDELFDSYTVIAEEKQSDAERYRERNLCAVFILYLLGEYTTVHIFALG